jgi:hypothetical protein
MTPPPVEKAPLSGSDGAAPHRLQDRLRAETREGDPAKGLSESGADSGSAHSSLVPRMLACLALIPVLVVSCDARHQLLRLTSAFILSFLPEVFGFVAT